MIEVNTSLATRIVEESKRRWVAMGRPGEFVIDSDQLLEILVDVAAPLRGGETTTSEAREASEVLEDWRASILNAPRELVQGLAWFSAVYAFDLGDADPLADLIRAGQAIPPAFRTAVADAVAGVRLPKRRAAAHLKIPPAKAFSAALRVESIVWMCGVFGRLPASDADSEHQTRLEELAAELGIEPIDLRRELEAIARTVRASTAEQLGVSTETIENLLREVRRRVKAWPLV